MLKDADGKLISENTYWQSPKKTADYTALQNLKPVALEISPQAVKNGDEYRITVKLKNPSDKISFFNRLEITQGKSGDEVLPTFWSSNYITLFPREERTVTAAFSVKNLEGDRGYIRIDGNNKVQPVPIRK